MGWKCGMWIVYIYVVDQSTKYCYRFAFSHLFTHFLLQCCRKEIRCFIELFLLWNFEIYLKIAMLANGASHGFCTKKSRAYPRKMQWWCTRTSHCYVMSYISEGRQKEWYSQSWSCFFVLFWKGGGVGRGGTDSNLFFFYELPNWNLSFFNIFLLFSVWKETIY